MRCAIVPAALALLLAGCEPSGKSVLEKHRGPVEARIKLIEEYAEKVQAGTAEQTPLALPDGVKLKFKKDGEPGNAIDVSLEEAQGKEPTLEYVHGGADLVTAREQLKGEGLERGRYVQSTMDCLLKPRFLAIVKDGSLTMPEFILGDDKHFKGGSLAFEVYVFDLQEKKELGMVKGTAESSDSVLARTDAGSNTNQDLKSSMELSAGVAYAKAMAPYTE